MSRFLEDEEAMLARAQKRRDGVPKAMVVEGVPWDDLPAHIRDKLFRSGKPFLTRNSQCLCGSGRRYKRCCMLKE